MLRLATVVCFIALQGCTLGPDTELEDLAALMVKQGVNPVPVVEDGKLVGVVNRYDIVRMMATDTELYGADGS